MSSLACISGLRIINQEKREAGHRTRVHLETEQLLLQDEESCVKSSHSPGARGGTAERRVHHEFQGCGDSGVCGLQTPEG